MSRSMHKQMSVAEHLLIVLLSGQFVSLDEITTTLQGKLVPNRIATYMWELKKLGAVIIRTKKGNKIEGYTLTNSPVMQTYLANRKAAGAHIPDLQLAPVTSNPVSEIVVASMSQLNQELVTA